MLHYLQLHFTFYIPPHPPSSHFFPFISSFLYIYLIGFHNTFQLGREGYIELTMVSDLKSIEAYKPVARELLGNIEFNEGKRYSDFNAATDKVAEYGLAALVGGLAAKKLGLLAVIGALLAKFGKLIFVGVVAVGALFKGLWRKKDKNQSEE